MPYLALKSSLNRQPRFAGYLELHRHLRCLRNVPRAITQFFDVSSFVQTVPSSWSDLIHDEWVRNLLANRPDLSLEQLSRCRMLMDRYVPASLVTGFEELIPSLYLPDPEDRIQIAGR